jgi:hypothetical protein
MEMPERAPEKLNAPLTELADAFNVTVEPLWFPRIENDVPHDAVPDTAPDESVNVMAICEHGTLGSVAHPIQEPEMPACVAEEVGAVAAEFPLQLASIDTAKTSVIARRIVSAR